MKNTITKLLSLTSAVCLSLSFASAQGSGQFFIGGSYGLASEGDESTEGLQGDNLFSFELGQKYSTSSNLSHILSLEILGSTYEDDFVSASSIGFLVNYKAEFEFNSYFSAYIGGGLGSAIGTLEVTDYYGYTDDASESVLAYQAMFGIEVKPTEKFGIYVQYRYISGTDFEDVEDFTAIEDNYVDLGARFYF